jgi:hypothetical protein
MSHRVVELHSIMPIANISSVLQYGILSHEQAAKFKHISVAMQDIQDKRDNVQVPNGLKLHQYANLYFHARNPMMYLRKNEIRTLCVLRISIEVLKIEGVVLTDGNAASTHIRFLSHQQIKDINFDMVYAEDWRDQNEITFWQKKSAKCAEVLIPQYVPAHLIFGAYISSENAMDEIKNCGFNGKIEVNPHMFFL